MEFTFSFIRLLFWGIYLVSPILMLLGIIIVILGLTVGRLESWSKFNSLYWAFITAFTVGYGDIRPLTKSSKILSILIAGVGLMLTGIFVAITVHAATSAFSEHVDTRQPQQIQQRAR